MAKVLSYLALIYLCVGGYLWLRQESLLFPAPAALPGVMPARAGLGFEDLRISVKSGGFIPAWWIPAESPQAKTAVFFHGNAYTLEYMVGSELPALRALGVNLLLVDYRGYGASSPMPPPGSSR